MNSGIEKAIDLAGGAARLAAKIGESVQTIGNWKVRGVPAEKCPLIEKSLDGAIRCEDLRPDVAWGVLREQAAPSD